MRLFTFALVIFLVLFLFGCDKKSYDIDGEWQRFDTVWTFKNGKAHINGRKYDYFTNGTEIVLKKDGEYSKVPYFIKNNTLTVNGVEFHRYNRSSDKE